jgi:dTDP-4-amino-4,6-dideoxygalactose transaminase
MPARFASESADEEQTDRDSQAVNPEIAVPLIDLVSQHQTIDDEIYTAIRRVVDRQNFVLGEEVAELESEISKFCDSRHAIGCASGTDALILSLLALGVKSGDEIITSPFTFFASGGAIHRVGAKPVFVDIEPDSFNLDPEQVERAVSERTRAILPVHLFGQCAEMEPLWRIAVRCGLAIVEDACQAIGAEYRGRRAGVLGTLGCFSFFPTKNLGGAGDGGLITTDDIELCERVRRLRVHGQSGQYQHDEVGLNSRLDALQAAMLRVKLGHLDKWTAARQQNARTYGELLRYYGLLDSIEAPTVLPERKHVFNQYTVRIKNGQRDTVLEKLRAQNIGCGIYYPLPLHLQPCFQYLGYSQGSFPEAETASHEVLSLPIVPELQPAQLETVVRGLARALGRNISPLPFRYDSSRKAA